MIQLKSAREIGLMRKAGLAVWKAHQIAKEMVVPGATTQQIDDKVAEYFKSRSATPLFLDYPNAIEGKPRFPAVCCMSVNEAVVHGIPNDEPLKEGDILSLDTGCKIGGWCGDSAWTYPVGKISDQTQALLETTEGVLMLAVELLKTKNRWSEVAREMGRYVSDRGFHSVECFVGHGIGRNLHEDPQVPNYFSRGLRGNNDFKIEPGLVIAVEPMVNVGTKEVVELPDYWTQVTRDGSMSAHFEHTIAITSDGPKLLTGPPAEDELELLEG